MSKSTRGEDPGKLARTALRSAASNNLQLYTQADKKAQILIQVNALMITVLLGSAVHLSEFHRLAIIPVAGQIVVSLIVILLSLRSTRPAAALPPHPGGHTIDLLHFGDYDHLDDEEYMTDMTRMLEDADRLYESLTRNVYYQSQVLSRKYRYLRLAFISFTAGLVLNILAAIAIAL